MPIGGCPLAGGRLLEEEDEEDEDKAPDGVLLPPSRARAAPAPPKPNRAVNPTATATFGTRRLGGPAGLPAPPNWSYGCSNCIGIPPLRKVRVMLTAVS
jgi:hypothetical protein